MNPTPEQLLTEAHKQWLDHPVTVQFLVLLEKREVKYRNDLHDSVEKETNEKYQESLRANLSSIKAVMKILQDTPTFTSLSIQPK